MVHAYQVRSSWVQGTTNTRTMCTATWLLVLYCIHHICAYCVHINHHMRATVCTATWLLVLYCIHHICTYCMHINHHTRATAHRTSTYVCMWHVYIQYNNIVSQSEKRQLDANSYVHDKIYETWTSITITYIRLIRYVSGGTPFQTKEFWSQITTPHWSMRNQRVEKMNNWSVESWIIEMNPQLYAVMESYKAVETILE